MAPRILWDAKGKTREEWLEVRAHGPDGSLDYTIGGSDIPIILNLSPWTTPLELWHLKKGNLKPDNDTNEDAKEMGHLMEPIIGHFYQKKTGNEEIEDTLMYQHATLDFAIADIDGRFREPSGLVGVLEKKFVTYHNRFDWADGMVPYMYEMQGRWYMGVVELTVTDYAAMWGNNAENDLATPRINRDPIVENMLFDVAGEFVQSLRSSTPPALNDPYSAKLAMQALARVYGKTKSGLPTIEFSAKFEKHIRMIAELQQENKSLEQSIKRNDEKIEGHSVHLAGVMKEHEFGEYNTATERFKVFYKPRVTKRPNSKKLKEKHPAVYEDVLKETVSRKITVEKEAI